MSYKKVCPHCGEIKTAYVHHLNEPLVYALRQLVDYYNAVKKEANLQDDLNLTKNQYNNFQKLQYFGLVKRIPNGWLPTSIGIGFIEGDCRVYNRVITFDDKVLGPGDMVWSYYNVKPYLVYVSDIIGYNYKQRSEYQREKSSQLSMEDDLEAQWDSEQAEKAKMDFFEQTRGV